MPPEGSLGATSAAESWVFQRGPVKCKTRYPQLTAR